MVNPVCSTRFLVGILLLAVFLAPALLVLGPVPLDAKQSEVQVPYIFRSLRLGDPKPLIMRKLEADPRIKGISLSTNRFYAFSYKDVSFEMCLRACARDPDQLCGVELTSPSGSSLQGYGGIRRFESLLVEVAKQQLGATSRKQQLEGFNSSTPSSTRRWTHFWSFPRVDSDYLARVGIRRHKIDNPLDKEFRKAIEKRGEPVITNMEYMAVLTIRLAPTGSCLRFPSASGRNYFHREPRPGRN